MARKSSSASKKPKTSKASKRRKPSARKKKKDVIPAGNGRRLAMWLYGVKNTAKPEEVNG